MIIEVMSKLGCKKARIPKDALQNFFLVMMAARMHTNVHQNPHRVLATGIASNHQSRDTSIVLNTQRWAEMCEHPSKSCLIEEAG